MKKPAMVLFDYGNTIITEKLLGFEKGNEVLLSMAAKNPQNITINELQPVIGGLIGEISDRMGAATRNRQPFEISWCSLNRYAYEYFGITFDKPYEELEEIYWDSIVTASPSENIEELCVADADILAHFDNITMLYDCIFVLHGVRDCLEAKEAIRETLAKDFDDLSEETKAEFEARYKTIMNVVIGE